MTDSLPRLLVVTGYPPNSQMGGGIILRSFLQEYPVDRLTILTNGRVVEHLAGSADGGGLLPVPHVCITPWRSSLSGVRRLLRCLNGLHVFTAAFAGMRRLSRRDVILAVPWGGELGSEFFAAAYLMHQLSGAALVVYEMDEWRASLGPSPGPGARILERVFHHRLVRAAKAVWVISTPLASDFQSRFGIQPKVLGHCVNVERHAGRRAGERVNDSEFRLLYTGAVYGAQADAIRNVLTAIQDDVGQRYSLVVYTGQSRAELAAHGIEGRGLVVEQPVPVEAVPELLATADALLLPFAFDPRQRAVVSTSFPTKAADYLASGVPILVHAPAYATVAVLARQEGWGEVVDQPCTQQLQEALRRLAADTKLRQALVAEAMRVARLWHDLPTRRAEFFQSIQESANSCA